MVKIDLPAMNDLWKRIIVRNRMAIETSMCNPRSSIHGSMGYLRTNLLSPGITDRYGVNLYELTKSYPLGELPGPHWWSYGLKIAYSTEKDVVHELIDINIPQMSFREFHFTLTEEYTIRCQVVCDYSEGTKPKEQEIDSFAFWLSHLGDEVLEGIEETVKTYEKKYSYVKWVSEAPPFRESE